MKIKTLLLLIIAFAIGCKSEKKTDNSQSNSDNSNTEVLEQNKTEIIALNGNMNQIPVSVALFVVEDKVYGFYLYSKVGVPINLNGYIDDKKQIFLDEYNDKIEKSAKIELKIDETTGKYVGKWYTSKKSLPLELTAITVKDETAEFETNIGKLKTSFYCVDTIVQKINCKLYHINFFYKYKKNDEITYEYSSHILSPEYSNNTNLEKAIKDIVKPFENVASRAYSLEQSLITEWKDVLKEYNPQDEPSGMYNYSTEDGLSFIEMFKDIYVFEGSYYMYTGGAHGMYGNFYEYADAKNGKTLQYYDILDTNQKAEINSLIVNKVQNDESLTEMVFEPESIELTGNIRITQDSLFFNYQPYEIGSYAAGIIVIPFSYKELKPYLKSSFKSRMGL